MADRSQSVSELLKLAREDIARNRVSSAEKTLQQAIFMNNQVAESFHLLGQVYLKRGKFKKAILSLRKALSLDPFLTEAAIALSSLYNDVGQYQKGAEVFKKTSTRLANKAPGFDPRIDAELAQKHFEMGRLYMRYERFREAHHEFSKALNLEPQNMANVVEMAKCLSKSGDKTAAIGFLRKALQTSPNHIDAKVQLGVLFHGQRQLAEAHREWQEALALDPENPKAQMYLSMFDYEPQFASQ